MSAYDEAVDPEQVAADDDLLALLGAGMATDSGSSGGDAIDDLLLRWRLELDSAATATPPTIVLPDTTGAARRASGRTPRRAAAIGALGLAAVLAMTGTAAALGTHGPLGALHRALFGGAAPQHAPDVLALRVQTLLDQVEARIAVGRRAGGLTSHQRSQAAATLAEADALLRQDTRAPKALIQRSASLRADVAGLPTLGSPSPAIVHPMPSTAPTHASSGHPESEPASGAPPATHPNPDIAETGQTAGGTGDVAEPSSRPEGENSPDPQPSPETGSAGDTSQDTPDSSSGDTGKVTEPHAGSSTEPSSPGDNSGGDS